MDYTINDTLEYIISLTRHIPAGDCWAATTALMIELDFLPHEEGFDYMRESILHNVENRNVQMNESYAKIVETYSGKITPSQIEQSIRRLIKLTWKQKRLEKWTYIYPEDRLMQSYCPSNKALIGRIACLIKLWSRCEVNCYETE